MGSKDSQMYQALGVGNILTKQSDGRKMLPCQTLALSRAFQLEV